MEEKIMRIKLQSLKRKLDDIFLKGDNYFPYGQENLSLFRLFNKYLQTLKEKHPDVFDDFSPRPEPLSSGTTDFGRMGYIERHKFVPLAQDLDNVLYALDELEPAKSKSELPRNGKSPKQITYQITGHNILVGEGGQQNNNEVYVKDVTLALERLIAEMVSDPEKKKSMLQKLKSLTKNPTFASIASIGVGELFKYF